MELFDLTGSLQRAVAPPGEFATYFPDASVQDLADTLADAVAEAQLDGFLSSVTLDVNIGAVSPDLNPAQQALVVLYARARILTSRLANVANRTHYKAGPVEAETEHSSSILVEILRDTKERKKQLLTDARTGTMSTMFSMTDMYVTKSIDYAYSDVAYAVPDLR